ncbi:hypothetical protein KP509_38G034100 [Ceratopteris richardii]|uniref:B box-type domain-containing protein n=1 Tax=Ceratopteris richardii TaxID=49495 RepID=A0A8T2Q3I0_CERRI|nr:hypothetical protein KP509_38G034100 [Ceratopteris richardii]
MWYTLPRQSSATRSRQLRPALLYVPGLYYCEVRWLCAKQTKVMDRLSGSLSNASNSGSSAGSPLMRASVSELHLRPCELCATEAARVYCAADEAQLCWDCDLRIHRANFLVARHPRSPICSCCGAVLSCSPRCTTLCQSCLDDASWIRYDEESKVIDSSDDADSEAEDSDHYDFNIQPECRWKAAMDRWDASSCEAAARHYGGEIRFAARGIIDTEEGMGDSQDEWM